MTKKRFRKTFPMIIGALVVALLVSIMPGSLLVEASKGLKDITLNKDIVEVVKVNRTVFPKLKTDNYIPLGSAEALALTKINDKTAKITDIEVVLIDNQVHYVVEVTTYHKEINKVFKISISGVIGKVIDIDVDIKDPTEKPVKDPVALDVIKISKDVFSKLRTDIYIMLESVESLALTKMDDKTAKVTEVRLALIDNQVHYIVEVTTPNKEINKIFKITINGVTGNVKDIDIEIKDPVKDPIKDPVKEGKYITKEEAIKIALAKIGKDAKLDEIEFEDDDHGPIYEIEMYDDKYEYELEIHAITGEILKFKKERD